MKNFFYNFDFLIFFDILFLSILSLTIIWSVSPRLFSQQLFFITIGFILFFIFSKIDYQFLKGVSFFLYFLGVGFLILTFLIGNITRGSTRWLQIGGFSFQPSELFKPFLILSLTFIITTKKSAGYNPLIFTFLLFILPTILVFKQPDLGNVIIYFSIFLGVILFSGINFLYLVFGFLSFTLSLPLIWRLLKNYQKERLISFLDPMADPLGRGYNILQSIIAVGGGGFFGRGLGRGTQSHLLFLPEFHTDFIFASLSEELGFLGAFLLLSLYGFLLLRILKIIDASDDSFARIVSFGVFIMLLSQVFINIGMNIGILPITGITLPLISYGGSSILTTMISLGIVENIAKKGTKKPTIEIR